MSACLMISSNCVTSDRRKDWVFDMLREHIVNPSAMKLGWTQLQGIMPSRAYRSLPHFLLEACPVKSALSTTKSWPGNQAAKGWGCAPTIPRWCELWSVVMASEPNYHKLTAVLRKREKWGLRKPFAVSNRQMVPAVRRLVWSISTMDWFST